MLYSSYRVICRLSLSYLTNIFADFVVRSIRRFLSSLSLLSSSLFFLSLGKEYRIYSKERKERWERKKERNYKNYKSCPCFDKVSYTPPHVDTLLYLGQDFFPFFTPSLSLEYILYSFPVKKIIIIIIIIIINLRILLYNKVRKYISKIA